MGVLLESRGEPSMAEVEAFRRDGVVALSGVLTPDQVDGLRDAIERVIATAPDDPRRNGFFTRSMLTESVEEIRDLCMRSPAPGILSRLLGEPRIYLYEDTVMVKEPLSPRETPWHQDRPYYPAGIGEVGTIWFALDVVTRESGAVRYVRGSHRTGERYTQPPTFQTVSPDMPDFDAHPERFEIVSFDLEPGDCLVHHGMTVHGAGGNRSATLRRRAVAISYCSAQGDGAYPQVWPNQG